MKVYELRAVCKAWGGTSCHMYLANVVVAFIPRGLGKAFKEKVKDWDGTLEVRTLSKPGL